jgi:hypothetical protein
MDTATRPAARYDRTREDQSNITVLEHVNLQIGDQQLATAFYVVGLQLTRDPFLMVGLDNMWINAGRTQMHLPTQPKHVQHFRGVIGLVVPDPEAVARSLERPAPLLATTQFSWRSSGDAVEATCPWGNRFRCHAPDAARWGQTPPGIVYHELALPPGPACALATFYRAILAAPADGGRRADGLQTASVRVGADQCLHFAETREPIPPYDGHHIAVYVADFSGPHWRMEELGLVSRESDAHEWRFIDIIDPDTKKVVYQLEHEVRSMRHPLYARPMVNRNPAQSNRAYARGHDAFRGTY